MLTSYLKSGQTVDFAIDNTHGDTVFFIEMLMTNARMEKIETIKLTPMEALALSDHIRTVVEHINNRDPNWRFGYTQQPQEEVPLLNLHPRAEQLLANADLNLATGEHNETKTRTTAKTETVASDIGGTEGNKPQTATGEPPSLTRHQPQVTMDSSTADAARRTESEEFGMVSDNNDIDGADRTQRGIPVDQRQDTDTTRSSGSVAEELDAGRSDTLIVTSEGKVAKGNANPPAPYGWEHTGDLPPPPAVINFDPSWDNPQPVTAALINFDPLRDHGDEWQYALDCFVDGFELDREERYYIPNDEKKPRTIHTAVKQLDGSPITMPLALSDVPLTKKVRRAIVEAFAQGFRNGALWESCRAED